METGARPRGRGRRPGARPGHHAAGQDPAPPAHAGRGQARARTLAGHSERQAGGTKVADEKPSQLIHRQVMARGFTPPMTPRSPHPAPSAWAHKPREAAAELLITALPPD